MQAERRFQAADETIGQSIVPDFQDGIDRLDVSDWGRIYTASALNISVACLTSLPP